VPEGDSVGAKILSTCQIANPSSKSCRTYDLIRNIMPNTRIPFHTPFSLSLNSPAKGIIRPTLSRICSRLQFREVRLKKSNLMLSVQVWRVRRRPHDAEVVPYFARVDGGRCLGDQLRSPHVLAIPICGIVQSDLGSLVAS
jgi:hypothetical protein